MIGKFYFINVYFVLHSFSPSLFSLFFSDDEFARLINAMAHTRNGNPPSQCLSTWRPMVIWSIRALALSAFHREHCDPFINDWLTRISISRDSHEPRIWERSTHTKVVSFRDDLLSTLPLPGTILPSYDSQFHRSCVPFENGIKRRRGMIVIFKMLSLSGSIIDLLIL